MRKKDEKNIILIVITVVWSLINIISLGNVIGKANAFYAKKEETNKKENQTNIVTAQEIEEDTNQKEIEKLKDADERTRIQQYCGKYFSYIESEKYEKAYDLLYPEFKDNYFKTLEDYTNYVKQKYPERMINVNYNNIERQGEYYILFVEVTDPLKGEKQFEQNIIIKENGFNDFVLSFQAE